MPTNMPISNPNMPTSAPNMPTPPTPPSPVKTKELIVRIESISKLYSDNMGRFPVRSCNGNYFIMLAYHVDCNLILIEPFESRHDHHHLAAADQITNRLQKKRPLRLPPNP